MQRIFAQHDFGVEITQSQTKMIAKHCSFLCILKRKPPGEVL